MRSVSKGRENQASAARAAYVLSLLVAGAALLSGCGMTTAATSGAPATSSSSTPSSTPTVSAPPSFSPAPGTYTAAQTITLADSTATAAIYYTTDGTIPTAGSTKYAGPITADSTTTITAVAIVPGYTTSTPAAATYTINTSSASGTPSQPAPTPPAPAPPGPTPVAPSQTLIIADATPGSVIYYTTDGSTPTINSAVYAGPITVSSTETVKAIAVAAGFSPSAVGEITVAPTAQATASASHAQLSQPVTHSP